MTTRQTIYLTMAAVLSLLLLAVLGFQMLAETGGTNSYALVAEQFLTGSPYVNRCFDGDCAIVDGRTYVIFPPFPGVVVLPLVWLNGVETTGFYAIAIAAALAALWLWHRIFVRLEVERQVRIWLVLAIAFASPLYYVSLSADGIWFFAQSLGFLFVTIALHETLAGRLLAAGTALGAALLCRQFSVFYAPLLLLMAIDPAAPLLRVDGRRLAMVFRLGTPVAIAIAAYLAYNAWRFGDPLDTGYGALAFTEGLLFNRLEEHGTWSVAYVLYNAVYLLVQGLHIEFDRAQQIVITGLDRGGTSVLAASPWLLMLAFAPLRQRVPLGAVLLAAFMAILLLFYHSNGFSQYNTQRYTLDWLPALLLVLANARDRLARHVDVLGPLVLWGMALNAAAVVALAMRAETGA